MSTSQFFHGSARGPGPKPISDEKCKVHIIIIMLMVMEKPEKDFPPGRPVARSPRGGPTMGRPAEWRPELVELADDSVSSTDATIPSSPRGARPMTGSTEAHLYISKVER